MDTLVVPDSKALRLARYLRAFVGLRSSTVFDLNKYESVLWFSDMPQEPDCRSPAWEQEFNDGDPWLIVHKQQFPALPAPPDIVLSWIDQQSLRQAGGDMPKLRPTKVEPDVAAKVAEGEEPPLVERNLRDFPDVVSAYDHYRPAWEAWSAEYRRRGRIQSLYADLFRLHTQVQKQGEVLELVLGFGLLAWPRPGKGKGVPVLRHTVTARVNLRFDPGAGTMRLECAAEGAQLRLEDDMLEADLRPERGQYASVNKQLTSIGDAVWDLPCIYSALKAWGGALNANTDWSPSLRPSVGSDGKPAISFAPALILRKRNQLGMVRIYDRIIDQLSTSAYEAPTNWKSLVSDEDDREEPDTPFPKAIGEGSARSGEICFPLPANREQRRIVEAIATRRGVLVQGPPGTGKSHTIANLVCHLLASGKRVLITAETGRALRVLKNKLPEEIQPLCISLLGQGGDAFAELNTAVHGITSRFAAWSPGAHDERIGELERELDATRRSLASIDTELRGFREDETCQYRLANGVYEGTASAIAERVTGERPSFDWLRLPPEASITPPASNTDIQNWLAIKRKHADAPIVDTHLSLVASENLPTPADFGLAVADEREAQQPAKLLGHLQSHRAYRSILTLDRDQRRKLADGLSQKKQEWSDLVRLDCSWLPGAVSATLIGRHARWEVLLEESRQLLSRIAGLLVALGETSVVIPGSRDNRLLRADVAAVLSYLQTGGKWLILGVLSPRPVKDRQYLREEVVVDGRPADTPDQLRKVCQFLDLSHAFDALDKAWRDHGGLPSSSQARIRLAAAKEPIDALAGAFEYARSCREMARTLFAPRNIPEPNWASDQCNEWLEIVDAVAVEEHHQRATAQVLDCLRQLAPVEALHNAHPVVASLADAVRKRDISGYGHAYEKLLTVEQSRHDEATRQRVETNLNEFLPGFVEVINTAIYDTAWDGRLAQWERAWCWAVADGWLRKRADPSYQDNLWQRRRDAEQAVQKSLTDTAALRAWTHFFSRLTPQHAAALKSWREAVKAMGKATGRSAKLQRLKREARAYMEQCRDAIPIWIMPRYLVAEMIDPAPGRFDLIIVDEASQLGIESLFLFYIGTKMVVVGDDQQISPYGIGISDEAIVNLQQHFISDMPHHHVLSAQSSLYSNAKIRFGQNIVLREHFRCMPEIIQFSNDLCYANNGTPLDPLRTYPADRLLPLVVRHVADGYRTGSAQNALNEPEADAIVAQILACIADPRYSGRSMGVISLQGDAQAKLIEHKVLQCIEPEVIDERKLLCGDAYAFQGDERHVIFLSMVAAPGGDARIGVLANEFSPSALQRRGQPRTRSTLAFPFGRSRRAEPKLHASPAAELYDQPRASIAPVLFDSQFEKDVHQLISDRGFHVRSQVCVGDPANHRYRIDLVVEGMKGRIAVECDGDRWHGPDRYEQDMARQRDLERAGWQFVRIRGGEFYRDRKCAMEPLWCELERLRHSTGWYR